MKKFYLYKKEPIFLDYQNIFVIKIEFFNKAKLFNKEKLFAAFFFVQNVNKINFFRRRN